ncbi:transmembrane protein 72 isoform X1 [Triplophysa rosa]|uniref:transmembrane protein 72 isoform X1 n=1 Tax=Triplophysa rosa TaxID=992332 RepID=UPI00254603C5|nr:transmembrane protein 72 isoform X1 [Triplophysa rosa]
MKGSALWVIVECACRGFGISTAAVLCAVGIETLRQGEFHSLAVYLLISSVLIMLCEVAFFIDALLAMCLSCSPTKRFFIVWKKLAKVGGFQKFLYYTMMSVMCFLHPVLAWQAVIPGIMLLVTGFLNFILSKKKKSEPPKESSAFNDPTQSSVSFTDTGDTEHFHIISGKRSSVFLNNSRSHGLTDSTRSMLEEDQSVKKAHHKKTNTNMRNVHFIESIREDDSEMEKLEETTSEKAPILRL